MRIILAPLFIDDSTKDKLMKVKRTSMLNIDQKQLNNLKCENIYQKENVKEVNFKSEKDRTQQAREDETDYKGENSHMMKI